MAQVKPARKERKRYVVYAPRNDTAVLKSYNALFGSVGAAHAGIIAAAGDADTGILRVTHSEVACLKAALVHAQKTSLLTTGTLKRAKQALGN